MADVNDTWYCPYCKKEICMGECDDYTLIAKDIIRDATLIKEEDIPKLLAVCEKCEHFW